MARESNNRQRLLGKLLQLRRQVHAEGEQLFERWRPSIDQAGFRASAFNLACYLSLRRRDLRQLQLALAPLGLSSLGRCEAHVLASLDAVIAALASMIGERRREIPAPPSLKHFLQGWEAIETNAARLFGTPATRRRVRIMVTLTADAADDYGRVRNLICLPSCRLGWLFIRAGTGSDGPAG